jgi:hypothetical protein
VLDPLRRAKAKGDIIPEWRAKSSWNAERDQIRMLADIIADSRVTSPGIGERTRNSASYPGRRTIGVSGALCAQTFCTSENRRTTPLRARFAGSPAAHL